jgi:hypothetical protein
LAGRRDLIVLRYNIPIHFTIHPYTHRPKWALPEAA